MRDITASYAKIAAMVQERKALDFHAYAVMLLLTATKTLFYPLAVSALVPAWFS